MSTEKNKEIIRKHLKDVLEQGRVELIPDYYAPDGSVPTMDTPEQWKDRVLWHHKAGPGFKITILEIVAEGDQVSVLWRADFTYSVVPDPLPDEPPYPFGKTVSWNIANFFRIIDGKLVSQVAVNEWMAMRVKEGMYVLAKPEPS